MADLFRLARHLDETLVDIRRDLGATVEQLHCWTGGFPSSASGAAPSSVGGFGSVESVDDVVVPVDRARRVLVRVFELVDLLVVECGDLGDSLRGEMLPHPAERLAARLAFIQWQVNKLRRGRLDRSQTSRLERAVRLGNELAGVCSTYRPPDQSKISADVCHWHRRAGGDAMIDAHFRRWYSCRWCGDFRSAYGVNPPVKAVKMHDKGQKVTPSALRSMGIIVTASPKGA